MTSIVLPYKAGSRSASALANALGVRKINLNNSRVNELNRTIINWGNSGRNLPPNGLGNNSIINSLESVSNASCKLQTMRILQEQGVRTPQWTTSQQQAAQWLSEGKKVVSRSILNGNSGNGIGIHTTGQLPNAPLFTMYVPKSDEYRVHVFKQRNGTFRVFDLQRKARSRNTPDDQVNWEVRNLEGGFIFMREGVTPSSTPNDVIEQAISSIRALGLDFGAVDVVWNNRRNEAYVLEVNTAPGLEGTTLERYSRAFANYLAGEFTPELEPTPQQPTRASSPVPPITSSVREEVVEERQVERPSTPVGNLLYGVFYGSVLLKELGLFRSQDAAERAQSESTLCANLPDSRSVSVQSIAIQGA